MICEKCNTEMNYFQNGQSQGWTCSNCGNGLVTSCIDDMQLDETVYEVTLLPNNSPSTADLKILSKISVLNILDSKKLATQGGHLVKVRAHIIADAIHQIKSTALSISISPNYPYDK